MATNHDSPERQAAHAAARITRTAYHYQQLPDFNVYDQALAATEETVARHARQEVDN